MRVLIVNFDQIGGNDYKYDVLNRLISSTYKKKNTPNWSLGNSNELNTSYVYDPNGNVFNLNRRAPLGTNGTNMDSLVYTYNTRTNRHDSIRDLVDASRTNFGDFPKLNPANSYTYDGSGNLINDSYEGISGIQWTADGKVKSLFKTNDNETISFEYDAQGRRIKKKTSKTVEGLPMENNTYYMRDANGEVMAIYDAPFSTERIQPTLGEWHVYGSESHGRFETVKPTEQTFYTEELPKFDDSVFTRKLRFREFELKDHLGNVRVTFSDLKLQPVQQDSFRLDLLTVNNYYPFGMNEPDRNYKATGLNKYYRYGYNGKERDNELKGESNSYDYGARMYDNKGIRWFSRDPLADKYPSLSSYCYVANNPINAIDPDGKLVLFFNGFHWGDGVNGFHWGDGGTPEYWEGYDTKVMKAFNDNKALYFDGSIGGMNTLIKSQDNLSLEERYNAGYEHGCLYVDKIYESLEKNKNGEVIESIKAVSHSMGTAFERGFIEALMTDERFKNVKFDTQLDIEAFQAKDIPEQKYFHNRYAKAGGKSMLTTAGITPGSDDISSQREKKSAGHSIKGFDTKGINKKKKSSSNVEKKAQKIIKEDNKEQK